MTNEKRLELAAQINETLGSVLSAITAEEADIKGTSQNVWANWTLVHDALAASSALTSLRAAAVKLDAARVDVMAVNREG